MSMAISTTTSVTEGRKLVLHVFLSVHAEDWKAVNAEVEMMKNGSYLVTQKENSSSVTRGTQVVAFLLCLICMCHNTLDHATNMLCNNSESSTILQKNIQKTVQRLSLHWCHKFSRDGTVLVVKDSMNRHCEVILCLKLTFLLHPGFYFLTHFLNFPRFPVSTQAPFYQ